MREPILIVGLGQLGSRYLQGLINNDPMLTVDILEPSDEAYEKCLGIISSAAELSALDIKRVTMESLVDHYIVCIVATTAAPRSEIISNISSKTRVGNWVIEKVLAQSEEQLQTILDKVRGSDGAWVNTPRRRTSLYRTLKQLLDTSRPIRFEANFANLGLGCNAIHFIDVASWLVDSPVACVEVSSPRGWKPSKRDGYKEFEGELTAYFEDSSLLRLKSDFEGPTAVTVYQNTKLFRVSENEGIYAGERFYPGRVEYQSELSHALISDIIKKKIKDGLPTVKQSVDQHIAFFKAIRNCETLQINSDLVLPIS
jgi:hypothetical protein